VRNLASIPPRQVIYLWIVGILIIPVIMIFSGWLVIPQRNATLRHFALRRERERHMDSAAIAALGPDTSMTLLYSARKDERFNPGSMARNDSAMAAHIARVPADTVYDPYNESPAAVKRLWVGGRLAFLSVMLIVINPVLLFGFTVAWGYTRWRGRRSS
jgi:hypothetical protein